MFKLKAHVEARCGAQTQQCGASDLVARTLRAFSTDRRADFVTEVQKILELGCERLHMDAAALARIEDDRYQVVHGRGDGPAVQPGYQAQLQQTLCELAVRADAPIGLDRLSESKLRHHPAHTQQGIEAYLGTPVRLGTDLWGTLSFFRQQPWSQEVSNSDIDLIEFLGGWVESSLQYQSVSERLDELAQQVETLAEYDPLTGVLSRHGLRTRLNDLAARHRTSGEPLSVMLVDIDDFGSINGEHGHDAGDQLLKQVAEEFALSLRPNDMVGRVGGDKFMILLPGVTRLAAANAAAHIQRELGKRNPPVGLLGCTVSVGISELHACTGDLLDGMLVETSQLLSQSKTSGKSRITCA